MWTFVLFPIIPSCKHEPALTRSVCLNRPDYEEGLEYELGEYTTEEFNALGLGPEDKEFEYPFLALKKLLSDGSFYYSLDFNLTDRLQDR